MRVKEDDFIAPALTYFPRRASNFFYLLFVVLGSDVLVASAKILVFMIYLRSKQLLHTFCTIICVEEWYQPCGAWKTTLCIVVLVANV